MCIRDRDCLEEVLLLILERTEPLGEQQVGEADDGVERRPPVSYTHLRAHETVLDLVCRLLLEKKKNKQRTLIPSSISSKYKHDSHVKQPHASRHHIKSTK